MTNSDILDMSSMSIEQKGKLFTFLAEQNVVYSVGIELYEAREIVEELEYESSWQSSSC